MAFHPLVDLLRRQFGVEESDGEAAIAAKIERGVDGRSARTSAPVAPYLRALLSVDPGDADVRAMSPAERRGETFEALRRLLVRAAERRPQVLVIEDLHWIDSASEQFLATLVDSVPALRALLVFTYRPGYANPFGERSYFTRIVPAPLSAEDSARMAAAVLATDALPAELRALVARQGRGQPVLRRGAGQVAGGERRAAAGGRPARAGPAGDRDRHSRHHPGRDRGAHRPAGRGAQADAPARLGDRARVHPAPRRPPRRDPGADRGLPARADRARADPRAPPLPRAGLHVQARAHPGRGLRLAPRPAAQGAARPHRARHRGAVRRSAPRALRDARPPLLARRGLGAGARLPAQGRREGDPGVRPAPGARPVRRGARGRRPAGRARCPRRRSWPSIARAPTCSSASATSSGRARRPRRSWTWPGASEDRAAEAGALVQLASALAVDRGLPARARAGAGGDRDRRERRGPGPAGRRPVRPGLSCTRVSGRLDAAEADVGRALDDRAGGRAIRSPGAARCISSRCAGAGRASTGRAWSSAARESGSRASIGSSSRSSGASGTRGWPASDLGDYDAGARRARARAWRSPRRSATTPSSRASSTRSAGSASSAGTSRRGIELSERSYEVTERSSRAGHGTGAERRAFIRNNEADAWMAQGDLAAAAEALDGGAPHRPASAALALDDLALLDALLREPGPARAPPGRPRARPAARRPEPRDRRADPVAEVRELGVADQGRERHRAAAPGTRRRTRCGARWRIAEAIGQPRQTWLSQRRARPARRGAGPAGRRARALPRRLGIITGLRAATRDPGLRAGLESSPLIREVESLIGR